MYIRPFTFRPLCLLLLSVTVAGLNGCAISSGGYIENEFLALDFLTNTNEDRNYTQGNGWTWQAQPIDQTDSIHSQLGRTLNHKILNNFALKFSKYKHKRSASYNPKCYGPHGTSTVGITAFTPENLRSFEPQPGYRPYASLVALNATQIRDCEYGNKRYSWQQSLNFGLLGTSLGEDFQRWAHETLTASGSLPNGWDNQISNGGEPTFMYSIEKSRLLRSNGADTNKPASTNLKTRHNFQLYDTYGASIGYYTTLYAGLGIRYSRHPLSTQFYNTGNSDSQLSTLLIAESAINSFFFAKAKANVVGYNSMLQGQFRSSPLTYTSDNVKRLVMNASIGYSNSLTGWCNTATYLFGNPFSCGSEYPHFKNTRMTYALHYRSQEYESDVDPREHFWAGLYFSRFENSARAHDPQTDKLPSDNH